MVFSNKKCRLSKIFFKTFRVFFRHMLFSTANSDSSVDINTDAGFSV